MPRLSSNNSRVNTIHAHGVMQRRIQGGRRGLTPPPPRTAQVIVKFGEKVLQIDYMCCK